MNSWRSLNSTISPLICASSSSNRSINSSRRSAISGSISPRFFRRTDSVTASDNSDRKNQRAQIISATAKNKVPSSLTSSKIYYKDYFRHSQQVWCPIPDHPPYAKPDPNVSCLNVRVLPVFHRTLTQTTHISLIRKQALGKIETFIHLAHFLTQRVQFI